MESTKKLRANMEVAKIKHEEMMRNRVSAELQLTDWLTEIKVVVSTEFEELTTKNTELVTTNEILL